jgi:hypothetical protein
MQLFGWYRDGEQERLPLFTGIQGDNYRQTLEQSQRTFDGALSILKQQSTYMLNISNSVQSKWSHELTR